MPIKVLIQLGVVGWSILYIVDICLKINISVSHKYVFCVLPGQLNCICLYKNVPKI